MMYENIEMPMQKYTQVDVEYTGTDDELAGKDYKHNKKSQMTINAPNPIEINQLNMFNHSHSINNESFGLS